MLLCVKKMNKIVQQVGLFKLLLRYNCRDIFYNCRHIFFNCHEKFVVWLSLNNNIIYRDKELFVAAIFKP